MDIGKRAYYNALRLDWLQDSSIAVEDWQVEDYREMPYSLLFERLRHVLGEAIDRTLFVSLTEESDSPEELSELLFKNHPKTQKEKDRIYLLVFELWRRLVVDRPSISIFCDELDHQIALYEQGHLRSPELLEDLIGQLQLILNDGIDLDEGDTPEVIFSYFEAGMAHNLEDFLVEFMYDQYDQENTDYLAELFEGFQDYLKHNKWFKLLGVKRELENDSDEALESLKKIIDEQDEQKNSVPFNLELLHLLADEEQPQLFYRLLNATVPLIEEREDFEELLELCIIFYAEQEQELPVQALEALLKRSQQGGSLNRHLELLNSIVQSAK